MRSMGEKQHFQLFNGNGITRQIGITGDCPCKFKGFPAAGNQFKGGAVGREGNNLSAQINGLELTFLFPLNDKLSVCHKLHT